MNIIAACDHMNIDVITLFRLAYIHVYGKPDPTDGWNDLARFKIDAVVPSHVRIYLSFLNKTP